MQFKTKKQRGRYAKLLPAGIPKYIRVYDNGGPEQENGSIDRYTCVFTGHYTHNTNGAHWYTGFNSAPFSPQGIGMHEEYTRLIDVNKDGWPPAIGKKNHLGTRISFNDLPEDGKKFVMQDYLYLWNFTNENGQMIN